MHVSSLGRWRLFSLGIVLIMLALLGTLVVPEAPGRAPAPAKKKDKYDKAVERGLQWLALHQAEDGHWGLHDFRRHAREKPLPDGKVFVCNCVADTTNRNDVAATAFGLLPFLAAGHGTKKSDKKPDYSKTVEAGLKYLVGKQSRPLGKFSNDMYAHGLATQAVVKAYALTKDEKLKEAAQKALDFIVFAQDNAGGGWRYQPKQAGDLSVTGWQFLALKRGQLAGLTVPKRTLQAAERFLDSCETVKGGYGYTPGQPETISMTAVGLLCRQYSGMGPRNPGLLKGVQKLRASPPEKHPDLYYLYYANQVTYHLQGETWRFWNEGVDERGQKKHKGISDFLLLSQDDGEVNKRPHQKGSWGGSQGGRIMATSLSLLILQQRKEVPIYRRPAEDNEK